MTHLRFINRNDDGYLCVVTMWSVRSAWVEKHLLHVSSRQQYCPKQLTQTDTNYKTLITRYTLQNIDNRTIFTTLTSFAHASTMKASPKTFCYIQRAVQFLFDHSFNIKTSFIKLTIFWLADFSSNTASCHSIRCKSKRCWVGKQRWQEEQTYRCSVL